MTIDPKKFKQIVTNHLENVTEEEFLKTLRIASPYLFTERSEERKEDYTSIQSNLNLNILDTTPE